MKKNCQELILNRILAKPKGTIFINSDFKDIASLETVRKALLRITQITDLIRIHDGMYTILQYSEILKKEILPSIDSIVRTIVRKFGWNIYPISETALNIVGLSTQIPNTYAYLSDGPYRKFEILTSKITFKRTTNKEINHL